MEDSSPSAAVLRFIEPSQRILPLFRKGAGAWTACPTCGFQPTEIDDMAKSMMLTSHLLSKERMIDFSTRRRLGEPWNFSDEVVETFRKELMQILPRDKDGRLVP